MIISTLSFPLWSDDQRFLTGADLGWASLDLNFDLQFYKIRFFSLALLSPRYLLFRFFLSAEFLAHLCCFFGDSSQNDVVKKNA